MFPLSGFTPTPPQGVPARDQSSQAAAPLAQQSPEEPSLPTESFAAESEGEDYTAIGDRGALVRHDLSDRVFLTKESEHFVFHYLPGTEAEKDLEGIASAREEAHGAISSFLGIEAPDRISIYLFPSDRESYCPTWGKTFAGRTLPEVHMIGLAYVADEDSYEKVHFGHEITHALEYYLLPEGMRVPPYFREGLADYLSQSGECVHRRFIRFLQVGMASSPYSFTEEKLNRPEYMESASMVRYMVEQFGREPFLAFYRSLAILKKGESMSIDTFSSILQSSFGISRESLEAQFHSQVSPYWDKVSHSIAPETIVEIDGLIEAMDEAGRSNDMQALLSLYSSDFYYFSRTKELSLAGEHLAAAGPSVTKELEIATLGTWCYGKTYAVKTWREAREPGAPPPEEVRFFLVERLGGAMRLNAKYPGGWQG
ncbi:MAG: hypothetical protein RDV48_30425 [Candidatus Eremiobacteraeota bacterium]|nr:hypothetical protein [Candidatus Eremiobacteraeota bacterium]